MREMCISLDVNILKIRGKNDEMLPSRVVRTGPACVCINTHACRHTNIQS